MRRGSGQTTNKLIDRVNNILLKEKYIDVIDETWISPVSGYWLRQDCYRWEGQVKGVKENRNITLQIASWETMTLCLCKTLNCNQYNFTIEFFSGK